MKLQNLTKQQLQHVIDDNFEELTYLNIQISRAMAYVNQCRKRKRFLRTQIKLYEKFAETALDDCNITFCDHDDDLPF